MKVEIHMNGFGEYYWFIPDCAEGIRTYTRERDAMRGFMRFQARMGVL